MCSAGYSQITNGWCVTSYGDLATLDEAESTCRGDDGHVVAYNSAEVLAYCIYCYGRAHPLCSLSSPPTLNSHINSFAQDFDGLKKLFG